MGIKLSLPYVAGLVDGEGCISIHVNRTRSLQFANQMPRVVMQACVSNCHRPVLELLKTQFGGKIHKHHDKYNPRARDSFRWLVSEQQACKFIRKVYRWLVIKKKQADLLLELGKLKARNGRKRLSKASVECRLELAKKCGELNKRGR